MAVSFFKNPIKATRTGRTTRSQGRQDNLFNRPINQLSDLNRAERKYVLAATKMGKSPEVQAMKQKSFDFLRTHQNEIVNNIHKKLQAQGVQVDKKRIEQLHKEFLSSQNREFEMMSQAKNFSDLLKTEKQLTKEQPRMAPLIYSMRQDLDRMGAERFAQTTNGKMNSAHQCEMASISMRRHSELDFKRDIEQLDARLSKARPFERPYLGKSSTQHSRSDELERREPSPAPPEKNEDSKKSSNTALKVGAGVVGAAALGGGGYYLLQQNKAAPTTQGYPATGTAQIPPATPGTAVYP